MLADAQRDGRPAEYRWRRLRKFRNTTAQSLADGRCSMPCSNATKTRKPLKFAGVPQTPEPISAINGPKFAILWRHVEKTLLFNKFFSDRQYVP